MRKIQADYIFPISSSPIKNGILIFENDGTIIDLIDPAHTPYLLQDIETFNGVLCPGFVNAHCHLELSHLRGKITEKKGMANFISEILQHRFKLNDDEQQQYFEDAENEMLQNGIVAVGDISNFPSTLSIKQKGKLYYHTFVEVLALDPALAEVKLQEGKILAEQFKNVPNGNSSVVPHAPYTVSTELLDLINLSAGDSPLCIHLQESAAEIEFCSSHSGPFAELFTKLNFNFSYSHPNGFKPIKHILNHLNTKNNVALVHNTYTTIEDIKWANNIHKNLYWCLCPNANLYIENRLPAVMDFIEEESKIIIGTDSLASNHQLSVLEELKTISNAFPTVELKDLLKWSTLNGAEFLQIENIFGSFDKGKKPGVVLLENVDLKNLMLNNNSTEKKIL